MATNGFLCKLHAHLLPSIFDFSLPSGSSSSYTENAQRMSQLLLSQPESAMPSVQRAVNWIEYVVANADLSHLQSPVANVPFRVVYSLDMILALVGVVIGFGAIFFKHMVLDKLLAKAKKQQQQQQKPQEQHFIVGGNGEQTVNSSRELLAIMEQEEDEEEEDDEHEVEDEEEEGVAVAVAKSNNNVGETGTDKENKI